MNSYCLFDGRLMQQSVGYYSVDGPGLYGTFTEFICPTCSHKTWYGGIAENVWIDSPTTGCKCGVCSLQSEAAQRQK